MEYTALVKWTSTAKKGLIWISIISGVFTYIGASQYGFGNEDTFFKRFIAPALLVTASLVISIIGWTYAFERLPVARTHSEKIRTLLCVVFVAVMMLTTSSYYSLMYLAADRCITAHLKEEIRRAEEVFDQLVANRNAEKNMLPPLELGVRQIENHARNEIAGGLSGRRGDKRIVANIKTLQKGYANIVAQVSSTIDEHNLTAKEGEGMLTDMRRLVNDESKSATQKSIELQELFAQFNVISNELRSSAVPYVIDFVGNAKDLYFSENKFSDKVRESLEKPLNTGRKTILKTVNKLRHFTDPSRYRLHILDAGSALIAYPQVTLPSLAIVLSIDVGYACMSLIFLFSLVRCQRFSVNVQERKTNHVFRENRHIGSAISEPFPNHGFLWQTNSHKNQKGNQPRPDNGNGKEPPHA